MQNWPQIYHEWQVCPKWKNAHSVFMSWVCPLSLWRLAAQERESFWHFSLSLKDDNYFSCCDIPSGSLKNFRFWCAKCLFSISEPIIIFAAFFKQPKISERIEKAARQLPPLLRTDPNSQADILASLRSTSSILLPLLWKVVSEFWTCWDKT